MDDVDLIAIPDTDGELRLWLDRFEGVLLALVPMPDDPDDVELPPPLADGAALQSLQTIATAVRAAERWSGHPTLLSPDRRFELVPLLAVPVGRADVAMLWQAVRILGGPCDDLVGDVLDGEARSADLTRSELIAGIAAALTVLDPVARDDAVALAALIRAAGSAPLALPGERHAAYQRLVGEHLAVFHGNDPLAWFLYRGR